MRNLRTPGARPSVCNTARGTHRSHDQLRNDTMTTLAADLSSASVATFAPDFDLPPRHVPRAHLARRRSLQAWWASKLHALHLRLDDWMPHFTARRLGWLERREA